MQQLDKIFLYSEKPSKQLDENVLNQKFKALFEKIDQNDQEQLEYNFLLKYAIFIADNLENKIPEQLEQFTKILEKLSSENIFRVFFTLQGMFLQEVYLGPSFAYADVDKRLKQGNQEKQQVKRVKKFPIYDFEGLLKEKGVDIPVQNMKKLRNNLKNLNLYNYKFVKTESFIFRKAQAFQEFLEADGEQWVRLMPFTPIFIVFKHIIEYLYTQRIEETPFYGLWYARTQYFHNNVLFTPTGTIKEKVFNSIDKFFEEVFGEKNREKYNFITKEQHALLCVEYSNIMLFFYSYNRSKQKLVEAQKIMGVSYNFTGKMGVRTKYQTFKVAQLVVQVENEEEQKQVEFENQQTLNPYELLTPDQSLIKNEQFDEECILYETPKLDDEKDQKSSLNLYDQIMIIGIMKNLEITNPHDETYQEQIQAYCNILVDKSLNWLVFTNSLFIRSIAEFEKFKRMERALLQLQTLMDQFNDKKPEFLERALYVYPLSFPSQIELQKIVASKYMKVGMVKTAQDIFMNLELYEDCVECLAMGGEKQKALDMAHEHVKNYPNSPRMLCILGDLTGDFKFYKKAWKVSGKKFARAQRELGKVYFFQTRYQKSINAFKKATKINCLTLEPFFTMGCAYMKIGEFQNAISSFSSVVQINDSVADGWANMANCFLQLGKKEQAFATLEQAVKHSETSWRMWQNLLQVSLQCKKFYKYFECIQRLVQLDKGLETIDKEVLMGLNKIWAYNINQYPRNPYKGPFNTMKNRIERLYFLMSEKIGQSPLVWEYYSEYYELNLKFLSHEMNYMVYMNKKQQMQYEQDKEEEEEENQGKGVKFADTTKPTFKTRAQVVEEYEQKMAMNRERVYAFRLKSCQTLMVAGWEESKPICEELARIVPELIEAHKQADRGEEGKIEMERFLKTIVNPLAKNLGKGVQFEM